MKKSSEAQDKRQRVDQLVALRGKIIDTIKRVRNNEIATTEARTILKLGLAAVDTMNMQMRYERLTDERDV